ncbi:MAG: RDD family protein [Planctomycetaceae bacterium]
MAPAKWYYQVGNEKYGPITSHELQSRAAAGLISSTDLVWKEGLAKWMPASRIDSLVFNTSVPAPAESAGRVEPPPNPGFAPISRGSAIAADDRTQQDRAAEPDSRTTIPPAPLFQAPQVETSAESRNVVERRPEKRPPVQRPAAPRNDRINPDVEPVSSNDIEDLHNEIVWDFSDDPFAGEESFDDAAEVRPFAPAARPLREEKKKKMPRKRASADPSGRPAGFFRRFFAAFVDGIIVWLLMLPFGCLLTIGLAAYQNAMKGEPTQIRASAVASIIGQVIGFVIEFLYHAVLTSSLSQATFGKSLLSIRVTDTEGNGIDFFRAVMRELARTLPIAAPTFIFYGWLWTDRDSAFLYRDLIVQITVFCLIVVFVGHLIQPFTSKRQALHDMLAGTLVVND